MLPETTTTQTEARLRWRDDERPLDRPDAALARCYRRVDDAVGITVPRPVARP